MIADLHIHYPMHLVADPDKDLTLERMVRKRGRRRLWHLVLAVLLDFFSRLFNYRSFWSGPRVTAELMHEGGVRVGFSVLYAPAKEFDLDEWYAPPRADDLARGQRQERAPRRPAGGQGRARALPGGRLLSWGVEDRHPGRRGPAGELGSRLHHPCPPVLARRGDERQRVPLPQRPRVPPGCSTSRRRG